VGKAKGSAMLSAIKALRLKKEEARKALPPELHVYLEDRILVSLWYPEEHFVEILRALARVIPDQGMNVYEFMGRISAQVDLKGIYAHLVRHGDPALTLRRTAVIWGLYHDTGKEEVIESGTDYVVTQITGFENPSRESCGTVVGWNAELASIAGGKDVTAAHTACVLDGASACKYEVRWKS
jgi:hypothetical protein